MSGALAFRRTLSCIKSRISTKESFNNSAILSSVRYFSVTPRKNMKLVQFTYNNKPGVIHVGYVVGDGVVDLNKEDNTLSNTLLGILKNGDLDKVKQIKSKNPSPEPLKNVRLEAPITSQDKVLCIGLNYKDHCEEQNKQPPDVPMMFSKFASSVVGPNDPVQLRTDVTRLVQFTYYDQPGCIRVGYIDGCCVIDINAVDYTIPPTLLDVLWNGDIERIKRMRLRQLPGQNLNCVRLEAPITGQDKVLCIGLNYQCHCKMHNVKAPPFPMVFSKFTSSVIGPYDCLKLRTAATQKVDWEVELAVVIGKEASNVKSVEALDYVLGYTIAQDISARDWQKERNAGQFLLGKSMDTFCPIGPWIVTSDEIGDPQNLDICCCVNGELKQNSNTCQLVHKIPDVIERLTSVMTLYPGDIILTGTPGGVGMYLNPPQFLKPGDVITSSIQNIGTLETRVQKYVKP